jgi:hypothetical protein
MQIITFFLQPLRVLQPTLPQPQNTKPLALLVAVSEQQNHAAFPSSPYLPPASLVLGLKNRFALFQPYYPSPSLTSEI